MIVGVVVAFAGYLLLRMLMRRRKSSVLRRGIEGVTLTTRIEDPTSMPVYDRITPRRSPGGRP
jgi:hypothetical protein